MYNAVMGGGLVKIHIEVVGDLSEDEVIIRCGRVDETINKIHQFIAEQAQAVGKITFFKQNQEFYFPLENVLFFETEGEHIYAHTSNDVYRIKYRLYELEELLPNDFARVSKSTIVNIRKIYSITRNLTASSLVKFVGTHKQVYVSRHYYNELRQRLNPRIDNTK
jgi:DNA-binding LytR/AlgR family response regulator